MGEREKESWWCIVQRVQHTRDFRLAQRLTWTILIRNITKNQDKLNHELRKISFIYEIGLINVAIVFVFPPKFIIKFIFIILMVFFFLPKTIQCNRHFRPKSIFKSPQSQIQQKQSCLLKSTFSTLKHYPRTVKAYRYQHYTPFKISCTILHLRSTKALGLSIHDLQQNLGQQASEYAKRIPQPVKGLKSADTLIDTHPQQFRYLE